MGMGEWGEWLGRGIQKGFSNLNDSIMGHAAGSLVRGCWPHRAFPDTGGSEQQGKASTCGVSFTKSQGTQIFPASVPCSQLTASPVPVLGSLGLTGSMLSALWGSGKTGSNFPQTQIVLECPELIYAFMSMGKKKSCLTESCFEFWGFFHVSAAGERRQSASTALCRPGWFCAVLELPVLPLSCPVTACSCIYY